MLPPPATPIANFVTHVQEGNLIFLSGFEPRFEEAFLLLGPNKRRVLLAGNECESYASLAPLPDLTVIGVTALLPLVVGARTVGTPGCASAITGVYLLPASLVSLLVPSIQPPPLLLVAAVGSTLAAFQQQLFDPQSGLYRDGVGTGHTSLHANLFPLAFDLVPEEKRTHVADWLAMATVGNSMQDANWRELVENVVRESGGAAEGGVQTDEARLDGDEAGQVEAWLRELALSEKQERNAP